MAEGRLGGEFFTPYSIVRLIVEIIEPFHGKVYDPACGSGGMFVQCAKFVGRHAGSATRELRNLTRYRRTRMEERTRETQRLDKVLQDAGIKLSSVASDILGVSGREMLDGLVAGSSDPEVLAELARGALRNKIPLLQAALTGRFARQHAVLVGEILAHLDYIDESVSRLSAEIDRVIAPFAEARDRLCSIPGVNKTVAEAMSVFPIRIGTMVVICLAARGELIPGVGAPDAGNHLSDRFGGQRRLILVDVVPALFRVEEARSGTSSA